MAFAMTAVQTRVASPVAFVQARPVRANARPVRAVVSCTQKSHGQGHEEQQDTAARVFGAMMAASLVAMPMSAVAGILPETATSSAARAELNERTSNLPTLGDVAKSLTGNSAPNVAAEVEKRTPDVGDLKRGATELKNQVGKAAPDLPSVGDVKRAASNVADLSAAFDSPFPSAKSILDKAKGLTGAPEDDSVRATSASNKTVNQGGETIFGRNTAKRQVQEDIQGQLGSRKNVDGAPTPANPKSMGANELGTTKDLPVPGVRK